MSRTLMVFGTAGASVSPSANGFPAIWSEPAPGIFSQAHIFYQKNGSLALLTFTTIIPGLP